MKIGLLGGSFNPAHSGHLYISNIALKKLQLDEVWWLISPQNPLKQKSNNAPLKTRLNNAKNITKGHKIRVEDLETNFRTNLTLVADCFKYLTLIVASIYFFLSPECCLNILVGANSPNLCPTIFSLTKTGTNLFPLCTAKVWPTKRGEIVDLLDHVFITCFLLESLALLIFFSNL